MATPISRCFRTMGPGGVELNDAAAGWRENPIQGITSPRRFLFFRPRGGGGEGGGSSYTQPVICNVITLLGNADQPSTLYPHFAAEHTLKSSCTAVLSLHLPPKTFIVQPYSKTAAGHWRMKRRSV